MELQVKFYTSAYSANAIHTSSRTNRKRLYHNMKNLQSDRSNFDHQKGVKIFTLEKFYTRGANLHPEMYPCANFHNNRTDRFSRIGQERTDVRRIPSMTLG